MVGNLVGAKESVGKLDGAGVGTEDVGANEIVGAGVGGKLLDGTGVGASVGDSVYDTVSTAEVVLDVTANPVMWEQPHVTFVAV